MLGPLEIRDGSSQLDVPGRQERALLALLLTAPRRVFSVSAIVAGLWAADPPAGAQRTVQSYISRLRRALGGDGASLIVTRTPGYLAAVDPECVDAERFRALAVAGRSDLRAGRPEEAANRLRDALGLWRGEAFAEFDAPFAVAQRTALDELRLAAVEDRVTADLAMSAGPELVAELETLVGQHPWREKLWAQLMTALYRSGRQGDALGAFQRARKALVDELGVEPGSELRAVEAQVLAHDTQLLALATMQPSLPRRPAIVGPTFVGRQAELTCLLAAYDRAAAGSVERILLIGAHGIGKTRLLTEVSREAQARGALVQDHINNERPGVPVVVLLDDLHRRSAAELTALAELLLSARPPLLVVGAAIPDQSAEQRATISKIFPDQLLVPPLRSSDVADIVRLYVSPDDVADGVAVAASAAGVPLQVHAVVSRFGEERAATQVEEAAASIPGPQRRASESQERVAKGIRDRQRIRLVRSAHEPAGPRGVVCPYKGLMFFDVDDAPYFVGRERLVARLVAKVVDARFLAVVGPSGSGKSSVVRAGLVAALRAGMLPGSERWHTVVTTPTRRPPDLADIGIRAVVVVDQFEELFTTLPATQRDEYADWLASTVARDDMTVVVVVRSDYYAQAAAYPRLADLLAANTVLVGEMSPDELQQAVERPAAAAGLEPESGLAKALADDVAGQPGGLPLMSTALLSLWEQRDESRLTLAAYHAMGGVRTAVARLAETAYGRLTPNQQTVARRILLRLAETGETGEPVRRRAPIGEVAPGGNADNRIVLDTLAARRLLTVSDTHAEVAHEALLREWPRLRTWLDEDEAGRRLRRHLAPAARDWEAGGREVSELYRGPRLAAALDWQRDHPDELTEVERDFVRASQQAAEAQALQRKRSIRRLRALAVGLTGVLILALVAGALFVDQRNRADIRALQAAALSEDRWDRALLYAAQAQRFDDSADSRAALLQTVQRGPQATAMFMAGQALHSLAVSANGQKLVAGGSNGAVFVFDTETRQAEQIPGVTAFDADVIDISPDGRYVAAVANPISSQQQGFLNWQLAVVDLEQTPVTVRYIEHGTRGGARFAADSRTIIDVHGTGAVHHLDVVTGEVQQTRFLEPFAEDHHFIALSGPENRRFVMAEVIDNPELGSVVAAEVSTGRELWSAAGEDTLVAAISPDGSQIVSAHADGRIELIDVRTGASTPVHASLAEGLIDVTWAPDGTSFAGATQDRAVLVWDATSLEMEVVLRGHWGKLSRLAYSPDGTTLYAAALDQSVLGWDLKGNTGAVKDVVGTTPAADVIPAAMAADGSAVAVGYQSDKGARVEVTQLPSGRKFEVAVPVWPLNVWELVADRSGKFFVLFLRGQGVPGLRHQWAYTIDVQRGELLPNPVELFYRTGGHAVVTWDNDAILAAGYTPVGVQQVGLWDLETGRPVALERYEPAYDVGLLGVHPDGRQAVLSENGLLEVIDLRTGKLIRTIDHADELDEPLPLSVAFSPDGRWLASATSSGRVVIWNTRTWQQHTTWEAVPGFGVDSMVFTPDSDFLITGGAGQAAIWDVEQGGASGGVRLDVDPSRPDARVLVGVRDDGRTLVTFTDGTGIRQWDVSSAGLLETACKIVGRNLTKAEWDDLLPDRSYEVTCPQYPTG